MYTATGARHQQCKDESMGFRGYIASRLNFWEVSWHGTPTDAGLMHDTYKCMRASRKPSRFSVHFYSYTPVATGVNRNFLFVAQACNVVLSCSGGTLIVSFHCPQM